jgi:hypothetical protein
LTIDDCDTAITAIAELGSQRATIVNHQLSIGNVVP